MNDAGRFTRVDPIRDGWNHYAYVGGNPLGYVDPTGLVIKRFQTHYRMQGGSWASDSWIDRENGTRLGNSKIDLARISGCAITVLADIVSDNTATSLNPETINDMTDLFQSNSGDLTDWEAVGERFGLDVEVTDDSIAEKLQELDASGRGYSIVGRLDYTPDKSEHGNHWVGINEIVDGSEIPGGTRGMQYVEIEASSTNDRNSLLRPKDWIHVGGKIYVPVTNLERIVSFSQPQALHGELAAEQLNGNSNPNNPLSGGSSESSGNASLPSNQDSIEFEDYQVSNEYFYL